MKKVGRRFIGDAVVRVKFSRASVLIFLSLFSSPLFAAEKPPVPAASPAPEIYRPMIERSQLSRDELAILERGPISQTEHVAGGAVATFLGWGVGHAIQGRWGSKGWMFTLGEGVSFAALVVGIESCHDSWDFEHDCSGSDSVALLGFFSYLGFRVWEAVDAWVGPSAHNNRYYDLRNLTEPRRVSFFAVPTRQGGLAGIQYRF